MCFIFHFEYGLNQTFTGTSFSCVPLYSGLLKSLIIHTRRIKTCMHAHSWNNKICTDYIDRLKDTPMQMYLHARTCLFQYIHAHFLLLRRSKARKALIFPPFNYCNLCDLWDLEIYTVYSFVIFLYIFLHLSLFFYLFIYFIHIS